MLPSLGRSSVVITEGLPQSAMANQSVIVLFDIRKLLQQNYWHMGIGDAGLRNCHLHSSAPVKLHWKK
jgi:hypothetical protein